MCGSKPSGGGEAIELNGFRFLLQAYWRRLRSSLIPQLPGVECSMVSSNGTMLDAEVRCRIAREPWMKVFAVRVSTTACRRDCGMRYAGEG